MNGALLCIHSLCAPKYKHSEHFLVFVVVFKSINIHFIVHNIFSSSDSFIFIYSCCCLCCSDNYSSVYSCCYERKYVLILRAKIKWEPNTMNFRFFENFLMNKTHLGTATNKTINDWERKYPLKSHSYMKNGCSKSRTAVLSAQPAWLQMFAQKPNECSYPQHRLLTVVRSLFFLFFIFCWCCASGIAVAARKEIAKWRKCQCLKALKIRNVSQKEVIRECCA